ncbi:hypothetical protein ACH5RR_041816 [Cinchona calisaya]|uniref:Uncharacterized protein n=1 Tax=Cinchona calisaya TaxID=153742 RepID=A0ABD2Y0C5_9GENT
MYEAFGRVLESGVPWAAVLGNHGQESTMTRDELMSFISLMDYSLSKTFPSAGDNEICILSDTRPIHRNRCGTIRSATVTATATLNHALDTRYLIARICYENMEI